MNIEVPKKRKYHYSLFLGHQNNEYFLSVTVRTVRIHRSMSAQRVLYISTEGVAKRALILTQRSAVEKSESLELTIQRPLERACVTSEKSLPLLVSFFCPRTFD